MANGKYSAYQRLQPVNWNIGNDLLNSEDQEYKHREEQRIIADRKAAALQKRKDDAIKAREKASELKLYNTESESLNEVVARAIKLGVEKQSELVKIIANENGKYSQDDIIKAELALNNINNLPENLKIMTDFQTNEYTNYKKGVEEGKLFREESYESRFKDGYKGISILIDDSGMPLNIFERKGKTDINGDGKVDDFDVEDMTSLSDSFERPQFMKKYSWDAVIKGHSERLESAVNQTDNGYVSNKTTGVETNLLNQTVKKALYKEDGSANEMMLSFMRQKGLDPNKKEDLQKLESDYLNDVYLNTKRGKITDVNTSALNGNTTNTENSFEATLIQGTDGSATKFKVGTVNSKVDGVGFAVPQKTIQIGDKKITIQNFYLANNGKIAYSGNVTTTIPEKGTVADQTTGKYEEGTKAYTKTEEITGGYLKETELTEVAKAYGLTPPQLKQKLEEVKKGSASNSNDNKQTDYRTKYSY